jgi:hypothetical protein
MKHLASRWNREPRVMKIETQIIYCSSVYVNYILAVVLRTRRQNGKGNQVTFIFLFLLLSELHGISQKEDEVCGNK